MIARVPRDRTYSWTHPPSKSASARRVSIRARPTAAPNAALKRRAAALWKMVKWGAAFYDLLPPTGFFRFAPGQPATALLRRRRATTTSPAPTPSPIMTAEAGSGTGVASYEPVIWTISPDATPRVFLVSNDRVLTPC